jgi:peptidoglycan/xylan/chitin deacetylase (PgdA/CDA1 family)
MLHRVYKRIRYILGNVCGGLLFFAIGRNILLNKMNQSKILSIYFHNPSYSVFEQIIKWLLKHNFDIITITEFQSYYNNKKCKNKRTVFISFDDAWINNQDLLPIIEKYAIPITIFVAIEPVMEGQIWINYVRRNLYQIPINLINNLEITDLKNVSYENARYLYGIARRQNDLPREIMSKENLITMSNKVTFGSHSVTHPILTNCEEHIIYDELLDSKKILNEWGLDINYSFAYPNGNFNNLIIDLLKKTKYKYAFTTEPLIIELQNELNEFAIPRICIPDEFGFYENLARMSSVWQKVFLKK